MSLWYYAKNGQQNGPMSKEELASLAAQGVLAPDDLVWGEGLTSWVAARTVEGLPWAPPPPPQSAPQQVPAACPLCGDAKRIKDPRLLYNHYVCKKCYYAFTNRRQLAYAIDAVLLNVLCVIPYVNLLVLVLYSGKDCFNGQSLGKMICDVKVIDGKTGEAGGFGMSFKRNLPLFIPFMPLVIAFTLGKGFRTGDGWARSKVIWKRYENHPVFAPEQARP